MSSVPPHLQPLPERHEHRGRIVASGVITLVLGLLILFGWPGSTLWVLGTFLGVDLIVGWVTSSGSGCRSTGPAPRQPGAPPGSVASAARWS